MTSWSIRIFRSVRYLLLRRRKRKPCFCVIRLIKLGVLVTSWIRFICRIQGENKLNKIKDNIYHRNLTIHCMSDRHTIFLSSATTYLFLHSHECYWLSLLIVLGCKKQERKRGGRRKPGEMPLVFNTTANTTKLLFRGSNPAEFDFSFHFHRLNRRHSAS